MQRIVDARNAPKAEVPKFVPKMASPEKLLRPVSLPKLEGVLRKQLRRTRSDVHPSCLLDGVKAEICQCSRATEADFQALSQRLLAEVSH